MENKKQLLMDLFKSDEELFNNTIEELNSYNGYLGDGCYYDMDMLTEFYHGADPVELLQRAYFGRDDECYHITSTGEKVYNSFNPNRNYFYFNGYGNLCSADYKDYSCYLDNYFIDALIKNQNYLYLPDEITDILEG